MNYRGHSIGDGWKTLLEEAYNNGGTTVDDGVELRELLNVLVELEYPIIDPKEDDFLRQNMDEDRVEWMIDNFHSENPIEGWGYSYGSRFKDFEGHNQLNYVKEKLTEKPTSKSATITAMYPPGDEKHVPCICTLDFKLRDGLLMTAFFRSQDIGKKFYADMIALKRIQKEIADNLGVENNKLIVHVVSGHIYETDFELVEEILETAG
jgi:thymidylate synthase (methanogen type)